MPDFKALTSTLTFQNTNVVVVGGTQGIGAGIAIRFAELGAAVLIVGRNETLGSEMVKKLEKASFTSGRDDHDAITRSFKFSKRDLSRIGDIKGAAEDIAQWSGEKGVQYLFQCQGGISTGILAATVDAVKNSFNIQILSHFLIPYLLMSLPEPALRNGAQICNIASPGAKKQNIDFDDFLCIKAVEAGTFSLLRDLQKFFFIMDLFTHEFNVRFPNTHTTHMFPGVVATSGIDHPTIPWYLRMIARILIFFTARSPAQYADVALWGIASESAQSLGKTFLDEYGREKEVDIRVYTDADLRQGVWEKLLQLGEVN